MTLRRRSAAVLLVLVGGCSQSALEYGRELFQDTSVSTAGSNPFRCATCHELSATPTVLRAGYTLYDSTTRPSWWGGFENTYLDAMNQCVTNFMRGRALARTDEKARALYVYLENRSPDPAPPALPLTVVQDIVDVPSGDPQMGKRVYDQACGSCHGAPHTGAGRLSSVVSLIPDETIAMHGTDPLTGARLVTIEKVRHGKFFSIGGNMPLFSIEALSDAQLGAVLGYLEMFGLPPSRL